MVTILHAADLHLDSPFAALKGEKAKERRAESRQAVQRLVSYANDHGADLILLAGDLFDGDLFAQTAPGMAKALGDFRGHVIIAPGNHDYYAPGGVFDTTVWPDNVHIFKDDELEKFTFPELRCCVHGAAFTGKECRKDGILNQVEREEDMINIGVLHGDVGVAESMYRPITQGEIRQSGLDYLALGHVHKYAGVQQAGKTYWAYPGCPEGRGYDETGEKGFLFGNVDRDMVKLDFVPFAKYRYRLVNVDVTGTEPLDAIEDVMPLEPQNEICRFVLTGETRDLVDVDGLYLRLFERFYSLELRDETTAVRDLWEGIENDSLRGLFLKEMRARFDAAQTDEERHKIEMGTRFGVNAIDNREM